MDRCTAERRKQMPQKILIAMDDSENAMRAVEMVADSFSSDNSITLFNIMLDTAALCQMDSPALTPLFKSQQASFCALEDKKRELVMTMMNRAKEHLLESGFAVEKINIKIQNMDRGVARDILQESRNGYDLIVTGRRGTSGIKEFFMGSTSQKIVSGAKDISVLIAN
jgi:nucleotide-binding universal stress UspA family protein